jgi:hypothetical protein
MSLDVNDLTQKMLDAAKGVVSDKWPATRQYFESEAQAFAQRFASIEALRSAGKITDERAKSHVDFQKESWATVLLAVEGLSELTIEQALNAALASVRDVVNKAIGFALL